MAFDGLKQQNFVSNFSCTEHTSLHCTDLENVLHEFSTLSNLFALLLTLIYYY